MATKKRYSQAARVQGILRSLEARHEITIGKLAEEFGVTKRTLYRDIKALEDAGYPLVSEVIEGFLRKEVENVAKYHFAWRCKRC
ncbi:MAG: helix-turn-helix domain-containing protein [Syntrophaceae bacterium]|nr:helix-turn-helix domain-containing protein [Syntrophaceae bacterium]